MPGNEWSQQFTMAFSDSSDKNLFLVWNERDKVSQLISKIQCVYMYMVHYNVLCLISKYSIITLRDLYYTVTGK